MEYVGDGRFNLAYMRHNDKWWEVGQRLTAKECLERIRDGDLRAVQGRARQPAILSD